MIRKDDWQNAKTTEIPRGAKLLAVFKVHSNDGYDTAVINTSKVTDTFVTFPSASLTEYPLSNVLWWQSMEMPFGCEDDKLAWDYVLKFIPELSSCPHEKFSVDQHLHNHNPEVFGCMWRVVSPVDPDFSVDIFVRTTNHPKYENTLFIAERYRTMEVYDGRKQRILVDRIGHNTFGGDLAPEEVRTFLKAV